jgi:hypothetical protein
VPLCIVIVACSAVPSSYTLAYERNDFRDENVIGHENVFYYKNPNKIHLLQSLFYLTTDLHDSGVTITRLQEHKQL